MSLNSLEVYKDQVPDLIYAGNVIEETFIKFYDVPNGNALELVELMVYNDSAVDIAAVLWIGPTSSPPADVDGLSQLYVCFAQNVWAGESLTFVLSTSVPTGFSVYGWSTGLTGEFINFHLTGRVVTF